MSGSRVPICEVSDGSEVEVIAWVYDIKCEDGATKLVLRDASGVREFAVEGLDAASITRESLLRIKGSVRGGVFVVKDYDVIIRAPPKLPIDVRKPPADEPKLFARYSYLTIRSPRYIKILRVEHYVLKYAREFLESKGFTELLPPMISPCSDPGLRGAKKLRTKFYGYEYELTSSVIMFKQAAASSLEKIFFVARNVREEPPDNVSTGRHLSEFTQIDVEVAYASMWDAIKLGEELVSYIIARVLEEHEDLVKEFNPDLRVPKTPFKVLTYDKAVKILAEKYGIETPPGKELTFEGEKKIAEIYDEPVWIVHYPKTSRGFYYIECPDKPGYNMDFNLLLPRGYAEVIDGGEREYRYEKIVERLKELGEDLGRYEWFLELAKIGIAPSAGFGLGVERLVRYILGLKYIWEAVPFPKVPGIAPSP